MASNKQSTVSAAQRREQARTQRDKRMNPVQNTRAPRGSGRRGKPSGTNPYIFIGVLLGLVALVIGFFVYISLNQTSVSSTATADNFKQITHVSPDLLSTVNIGSVDTSTKSVLKAAHGQTPIQKGPAGKPQLFYMGGEFCPYCAAQRWALIVAVSRFGTFDHSLQAIIASEGKVPTYSFNNIAYHSQYLDFVPVEVSDNQQPPQPLQQLTDAQKQIVQKYDAPPYTTAESAGSFPFISVANQYVSSGAMYNYSLLLGKTYPEVVAAMKDSNNDISRGMLGAANYLTAAICKTTDNQPAEVCNSAVIQSIQKQLPAATASTNGLPLAGTTGPVALIPRRQD